MNVKAFKTFLVAAIVAFVMPAVAQENPMAQPLPIDAEVRYGVLDNGLT